MNERVSDHDRAVLKLEQQRWQYAGAKESAIRDILDMITAAYHQVLNHLIDREDALAHAPLLVNRLRRLRAQRQRTRRTEAR